MADLPTKISLTIVTRERKIIDAPVDEVILPATDGEIGILPGHTPMLAARHRPNPLPPGRTCTVW